MIRVGILARSRRSSRDDWSAINRRSFMFGNYSTPVLQSSSYLIVANLS